MEGDVWAAFAHDPRDPAAAPLRASDADREVIHGVLADAFATGRLDRSEYDERSASVLAARTLGDLPPLVVDLVPSLPATTSSGRVALAAASSADIQQSAEEKWAHERREAVLGFVFAALVGGTVFIVWQFPWLLIMTAFATMNMLRTLSSKDEIIRSEVRRLEKRRARELEKKQRDR